MSWGEEAWGYASWSGLLPDDSREPEPEPEPEPVEPVVFRWKQREHPIADGEVIG